MLVSSGEYIVKVFLKYNTGEHKVTGIFVHVTYKIPDSCVWQSKSEFHLVSRFYLITVLNNIQNNLLSIISPLCRMLQIFLANIRRVHDIPNLYQ